MNVSTVILLTVLGDIRSYQKYPPLCWIISHDYQNSRVMR